VFRRWRRPQLALLALVLAIGIGYGANALRHDGSTSGASTTSTSATRSSATAKSSVAAGLVALSSLPSQASDTVRLIQRGGPFPYSQDGVVFGNNEKLLPLHDRGYYHEYTVITPGADTRATRRIITGSAGEFYYTGDHYETFQRVDITK
jgi:ribonuclease T1